MLSRALTITPIIGLPLIQAGDDLPNLLIDEIRRSQIIMADRDVLVVAQKIVSKAEGRFVNLKSVKASPRARQLAHETGKDERLVEVILSESTEVLKSHRELLIVVHRHGYVMANAGVDQSNVGGTSDEEVLLLPSDSDASAASLKKRLDAEFSANIGVVINDSFGRPWRKGVVGVAIGAAGIPSLKSLIGTPDLFGRKMRVSEVAIADEIASAASLLMGQGDEGIPAVHIRGLSSTHQSQPAIALVREKEKDLFR